MSNKIAATKLESTTFVGTETRVLVIEPDWHSKQHPDAASVREARIVAEFLRDTFCDRTLAVLHDELKVFKR